MMKQSLSRVMILGTILSIIFTMLTVPGLALSEDNANPESTNAVVDSNLPVAENPPKTEGDDIIRELKEAAELAEKTKASKWTPELVKFLTVAILIFGAAVLAMMSYLVMHNKNASQMLRLFTVPLVIVASVFLVVTGFSNEQITPVVGLLGTIVGYILGSHSTRSETPPSEDPKASPKEK